MADRQPPAARDGRRVGPLVVGAVVVALAALFFRGHVTAGSPGEAGAPAGTPGTPPVVAQLPPSAVPAPSLVATDPEQPGAASPVVSPPPDAASLPSADAALPTPAAAPVAVLGTPIVVTIADDGTTLHLAVGQRFLLDLGAGADWAVKVGDEQIVQPVAGVSLSAGYQGAFEARAPGATVLGAVGSPHCSSGVCALFRLGFGITITVS